MEQFGWTPDQIGDLPVFWIRRISEYNKWTNKAAELRRKGR